jgi:hypothetical protein
MRGLNQRALLKTIILLLVFTATRALTLSQPAEPTVEEYLRLTQALMELSVQEWQERVEVATQNRDDRQKLAQKLEEVTDRHSSIRQEMYQRHGMSVRAALLYASKHSAEIESYLEENPDVKSSIESLKERINALVQQFEGMVKPAEEGDRK